MPSLRRNAAGSITPTSGDASADPQTAAQVAAAHAAAVADTVGWLERTDLCRIRYARAE